LTTRPQQPIFVCLSLSKAIHTNNRQTDILTMRINTDNPYEKNWSKPLLFYWNGQALIEIADRPSIKMLHLQLKGCKRVKAAI